MSGAKGSYDIPIPFGLRVVYEDTEHLPFAAAIGGNFFFAWRKSLGSKRGHPEISKLEAPCPKPRKTPRRD
jgi:hypothetical protein